MKKYEVFIEELDVYTLTVEANSTEEAESMADDLRADGHGDLLHGYVQVTDVYEVA